MKTEKEFTIYYTYDGQGEVKIKAKNQKEAEDRFYEGNWNLNNGTEDGTNYEISNII